MALNQETAASSSGPPITNISKTEAYDTPHPEIAIKLFPTTLLYSIPSLPASFALTRFIAAIDTLEAVTSSVNLQDLLSKNRFHTFHECLAKVIENYRSFIDEITVEAFDANTTLGKGEWMLELPIELNRAGFSQVLCEKVKVREIGVVLDWLLPQMMEREEMMMEREVVTLEMVLDVLVLYLYIVDEEMFWEGEEEEGEEQEGEEEEADEAYGTADEDDGWDECF